MEVCTDVDCTIKTTIKTPKKGGVWGTASVSNVSQNPSSGGIGSGASATIAALVSTLDDIDVGGGGGTATKFISKEMAKENPIKQKELELGQGENVAKRRAKAKKNELRNLAFGGL